MRSRRWCLSGLAGLILAGSGGAAAPERKPEARVSLPAGLDLEGLVPQLQRGGIRVVVADVSPLRAELTRKQEDVPLPEALGQVSADFDRRWLRRGPTLALQRRFGDPEEAPGVEIEELRLAAADMYGLIRPLNPRLSGVDYTRAKMAFLASLPAAVQQRMVAEAVPVAALPQDLRRAWLEINHSKAYASGATELQRAARCFAVWNQVTGAPLGEVFLGRPSQLDVAYPDPAMDDGRGRVDPGNPLINLRAYAPRREGFDLRAGAARPPRALAAPWLITTRRFRLGDLAAALRADGGPKLVTPAYAADREVLIASEGSRAEVLTALADLWGWEWSAEGDAYRLGRPRFPPARNPVELHERLLQAIPPPVWHAIQAVRRSSTARWSRQMGLVLDEVERLHGKAWTRFRTTELSPANQQRLANLIARAQMGKWYGLAGAADRPPAWVVTPERGVLRLSGPLGPGLHPMLKFEVTDDQGQTWMWGWAVGTSTLAQ